MARIWAEISESIETNSYSTQSLSGSNFFLLILTEIRIGFFGIWGNIHKWRSKYLLEPRALCKSPSKIPKQKQPCATMSRILNSQANIQQTLKFMKFANSYQLYQFDPLGCHSRCAIYLNIHPHITNYGRWMNAKLEVLTNTVLIYMGRSFLRNVRTHSFPLFIEHKKS